ncbi:MAG: adenylate/guanylate cyclase domain-containing protein, partial [Saprospiraceae bacterium]|nr:adenylate/guanylate cyclase domain-containing protein [Saprospiraceae bacterium]
MQLNDDSKLFLEVHESNRKAFIMRLRIENINRIKKASIIGLAFTFVLLCLDGIRFYTGRFSESDIYFYLFLTHTVLLFLAFPLYLIYKNEEAVSIGRYAHTKALIVSWACFVSMVTLVMAILSILDRGSVAMYAVNVLLINFVIIALHFDRILLNVASYLTISFSILIIHGQGTEMILVSLMEATAISLLSFTVSTNMFNVQVRNFNNERELIEKSEMIKAEKANSHKLLLNILPSAIADELIAHNKVEPKHYSSATVMMIDFKEFSIKSNYLTPSQLVYKIDYCFSNFDRIIEKYYLEKIKTLGDGYLCVGGVPLPTSDHPEKVVLAGLEILKFFEDWKSECLEKNELFFEGRIGIHTGPLIAGVVGRSKFAFDIWGDTVNIAARLESNSDTGRINISKNTFQMV